MSDDRSSTSVDLAASLTVAWLTNPNVRANTEDATTFLKNIHDTLKGLSQSSGNDGPNAVTGEADTGDTATYEPAVSVRKSLGSRERILSLIDGKPYATLKRHLGRHGLTPQQYRARYGLRDDYPMVAPAYAERRRELAKAIGLGRKTGASRGGKAKTTKAKAATAKR